MADKRATINACLEIARSFEDNWRHSSSRIVRARIVQLVGQLETLLLFYTCALTTNTCLVELRRAMLVLAGVNVKTTLRIRHATSRDEREALLARRDEFERLSGELRSFEFARTTNELS